MYILFKVVNRHGISDGIDLVSLMALHSTHLRLIAVYVIKSAFGYLVQTI